MSKTEWYSIDDSWKECPLCGSTFLQLPLIPLYKPELQCTDCGLSLQGETVDELKAVWNKRLENKNGQN